MFSANNLYMLIQTPPQFYNPPADDKAVPVHIVLFYNALIENGISTEMHIFPFGGHGRYFALAKGKKLFRRMARITLQLDP